MGSNRYVGPAYPQRDYFVGTVEGSEFAPFELTADADVRNATTVPVRISYRVNGVPYNRTVRLPIDDSLRVDSQSRGGGVPLWLVGAGLGVGVGVVGAAGVYVVRRR